MSARKVSQVITNTVLGAALVAGIAACSPMPDRQETPDTIALAPAQGGVLAETARRATASSDDSDAALLIFNAQDAMNLRLALIDSANVSLDLQYFVWSSDASGNLLLRRVLQAANRGVRVRLLVDDLYLLSDGGRSEDLAALDAHPNLELRIFNPGRYRSGKMGIAGNFAGNFGEFNRRMHNKLLVADGVFGMVGGRNLANEYYGLKSEYNFVDLDAMAAGAVVDTMIEAFDTYWNSTPTYTGQNFSPETPPEALETLRVELDAIIDGEAERLSSYPLEPQDWSDRLAALPDLMHGGKGTFLQDEPEPEADHPQYRLIEQLRQFDTPEDRQLVWVAPYLIPGDEGIAEIRSITEAGIELTILTASLPSSDMAAANSHYKKYRKGILEAGARLFEFHHAPSAAVREATDVAPVESEFMAFHPKIAVVDRRTCYVGSLNLDPRALIINTENGLVMESESFCSELADLVDVYLLPENSWQVTLDAEGELQWTSYEGTVNKQPARSTSQRMADFFFRILPIEDLL